MVNYKCPRCGYNSDIKTLYVRHLQRKYMCKKLDTTRKKIVIVNYLPVSTNTEKDKIVATVTNNMIEDGHTIRRVGEFVGCSVCNKAIPTQRMYNLLKLNESEITKEL